MPTDFKLQDSPFQEFLGLKLERFEEGMVEIRMPFRRELLRASDSDWLHGGVLSALIDIAADYAVATQVSGLPVPTIDLRIDYLRPARVGDLRAIGRTVKVGKTVAVANVEVLDMAGTLIAIGRGLYSAVRS